MKNITLLKHKAFKTSLLLFVFLLSLVVLYKFHAPKKEIHVTCGQIWEEYIPYAPRQEDLKANIETRKTFFGKEKEVPTFIQYDKIKNLFPEPQEKTN